ncbi:alpha/beta-hydrolase [Hymenopellis radicata]|nr:alpha/beta-hydrolase [Hymenopellis radicata]
MASTRKFGQVSLYDAPRMLAVVASLPLLLSYKLVSSCWDKNQKHKTWQRVLSDVATGHLSRMTTPQVQAAVGSSLDVYNAFIKQAKLTSNIETLDNGLQIAWIGPKRTDRVALYLHGGGFTLFAPTCGLPFLHHVQEQVNKKGSPVGFAVLLYTLHPEATFPTPLRETTAAVAHLINSGVAPKNLTLIGDSAGGNLILQLFSHMLHQHPAVNPFSLPPGTKFGGAFLMSPWVSLTGEDPGNSFDENGDSDVVTATILKAWGVDMMKGIPEEQHMYMEAIYASDDWFKGVDQVVDSVIISLGSWSNKFHPHHAQSELIRQKLGVHVDPFYDFFFGKAPKNLGELTPRIIGWMADVYKTD